MVGFNDGVPEKQTILAHLRTAKDTIPRFQIVLVDTNVNDPNSQDGLRGLKVAQVKLIFASSVLTQHGQKTSDISTQEPSERILAYVEWFSTPLKEPHQDMQMYAVSRLCYANGWPKGAVIPLTSIVQPCYLLPRFKGPTAVALDTRADGSVMQVTGDNCLDLVDDFWINSFQDQFTYQTVF
ncbi:hypothetical protein M422DRAFT_268775 [Sphaerobolus stellatus SS14]|uniref:Uncharacterized protein n=1 Tax=Sphaerobolus stellatus (strain SS14) TaxID=990650 RepID=A0A0C9ULM4_SPHS4|nr:hypothetical protein M422DRAFT_268775 [Sphaerobolus stellatus SS14]